MPGDTRNVKDLNWPVPVAVDEYDLEIVGVDVGKVSQNSGNTMDVLIIRIMNERAPSIKEYLVWPDESDPDSLDQRWQKRARIAYACGLMDPDGNFAWDAEALKGRTFRGRVGRETDDRSEVRNTIAWPKPPGV